MCNQCTSFAIEKSKNIFKKNADESHWKAINKWNVSNNNVRIILNQHFKAMKCVIFHVKYSINNKFDGYKNDPLIMCCAHTPFCNPLNFQRVDVISKCMQNVHTHSAHTLTHTTQRHNNEKQTRFNNFQLIERLRAAKRINTSKSTTYLYR